MSKKTLASMAIIWWFSLIVASYFFHEQNTHQAKLTLQIGTVGHFSPKRNSSYSELESVSELIDLLKIKFPTRKHEDPRLVETHSNKLHHHFKSMLNLRIEGTNPISVKHLANEILQWLLLRHERLYNQKLALITVYNPVDLNGIVYKTTSNTNPGAIKSRQNKIIPTPIQHNNSYSTNNWLADRYLLSPANSRPTEIIHDISIKIKYDARKMILPFGILLLALLPIMIYLYRRFRRNQVLS